MATTRPHRQYGDGTIDQHRGRWRVRININNTQRHIGVYPTKRAAQIALHDAISAANHDRLILRTDGLIPVATWLTDWIRHSPSIRSPKTRDTYATLARLHINPWLGTIMLADLTPMQVRRWYHTHSQASPLQTAKAYRLLRAALNTAVEDGLIGANPCRVKHGGHEHSPERPVLTPAQVHALADAMPPHLSCAVELIAWASLRFGEAAGLQRHDIDLATGRVRIARQLLATGEGLVWREPKAQSRRTVVIPASLIPVVAAHLEAWVEPDPAALVFHGIKGGPLTQQVWRVPWANARAAVPGCAGVHTHDLRHSGNTWAAQTGASLKDLMVRMGHRSMDAALRYQHATSGAQEALAAGLDAMYTPAPPVVGLRLVS